MSQVFRFRFLLIIYLPITLHLHLATMTCAHCLSHIITVGAPTTTVIYYRCRRVPLTVGSPGSLNLLNLLLLRH